MQRMRMDLVEGFMAVHGFHSSLQLDYLGRFFKTGLLVLFYLGKVSM